jgi:hypothetical protein
MACLAERLRLDVLASAAPRAAAPHFTGQANYLWTRIVAAEGLPLLDARRGDPAADAWMLAHAGEAVDPAAIVVRRR